MTVEDALKLAITILNEIPNQGTSHGSTYDILPKLERALKEKEINLSTTFGPKWVLGDIMFVAENLDVEITMEEAYNISKNIETTVREFYDDEEIGGISHYLIEKKILEFLQGKKSKKK